MAESMQDAVSTTSYHALPPPSEITNTNIPPPPSLPNPTAAALTLPQTSNALRPSEADTRPFPSQARSPILNSLQTHNTNPVQQISSQDATPPIRAQSYKPVPPPLREPPQSHIPFHAQDMQLANQSPSLDVEPLPIQSRSTQQQLASLIPPQRSFTFRQFLARPNKSTFTQEDIDNFNRHNPSTVGKNTVERFVEHLYQLIASDPDPDTRHEADALSLLNRNIDHRTMANLIQIYMDMSCALPCDRIMYWRTMKLQLFSQWRSAAPPRYTLPTALTQIATAVNRMNNPNTNQNNNRNSNFRSNNFRNNNNNNSNSNFNNNRQSNNNFNNNRNQSFNRNNRNFRFVRFVKNDNQTNNNDRQNNNNNQQQHTSVQNSNFNTNRNNNNSNNTSRNNNNNQRNNNNYNNRSNTNNRNNNFNTVRQNNMSLEPLTDAEIQMYYQGNLPDEESVFAVPLA